MKNGERLMLTRGYRDRLAASIENLSMLASSFDINRLS